MTKKILNNTLIIILSLSIILNFKYLLVNGILLTALYILILVILLVSFTKFNISKNIYLYSSLVSFFSSILLFDLFFYYKNISDINQIKVYEEGSFKIEDRRIYSKEIPSGYVLKDKNYTSILRYKDKKSVIKTIFDVEYNIQNGLRVSKNKKENRFCTDVFLLGGSHNFGWGLNFENTLQGMIESQNFITTNLSLPGFGLNNSLALLMSNNENDIDCNDSKMSKIFYVYRAIPDHIHRNVGKTSLNMYGPNFFKFNSILPSIYSSNCNNFFGCINYLSKYFFTRFNYYLVSSKYEKSSNIFGNQLDKIIRFQEKDFIRTKNLIGFLKKYVDSISKSNHVIVLIEDGNARGSKKLFDYTKKIPNISTVMIQGNSIKISKNNYLLSINTRDMINEHCSNEKSLHIKYDYHPTECSNSILFNILEKNFFNN